MVLFTLFTLSSTLPSVLSASVQGVITLLAVGVFLFCSRPSSRPVMTVTALILVYWGILILHSNIPSLDIGLLGWRKTAFCLLGLLIAVSIPQTNRWFLERAVILILALAILVSIALFLFFPATEQSIVDRGAADIYTGMFDGKPRLQGVFAGPFHVATAALVLIIWGATRFTRSVNLAVLSLALGAIALVLANVRTAYVALALAVLAILAMSASAGRFARRLIAIGMLSIVALVALTQYLPDQLQLINDIFAFSSDTRFLGRLNGYQLGAQAFSGSPVFGWGSGSAGDTLGPYFGHGFHVTSHNMLLKLAVEGGAIGLVLWGALAIVLLRALPRSGSGSTVAVALLAALCGTGLTGSALEALPITFLLFFIVGLQTQHRNKRETLPPGKAV